MAEAVLRDGARSVKGDTLLLVDPTEIRKEFSYKMEFVTRVRDASRSSKEGRDVLVNGYHGCMVARARAAIIGCSSLGGGSRRQNIATVIQTAYDLGGREMHLRRDAPAAKRSGWVSEANCEAAARPRAVRFPDERSEELCEAKSQEGARSPTRSSRWSRRESCPPRRRCVSMRSPSSPTRV